MASPWEVHVAGADAVEVQQVSASVAAEVWRIERAYSRYRTDNLVHAINTARGAAVRVDAETARLLDYAAALWQASEGRFDITTGALRRVWRFDGASPVPSVMDVEAVMPQVGWQRLRWDGASLQLPPGMEIDFGGIGKEFAVDRGLAVATSLTSKPVLINGGGDLAASAPPGSAEPWRVGIENVPGRESPRLQLYRGAIASSGDAHRHLIRDGVRYGHLLDPRTGWPVTAAARSVTVLADTCSQAGAHSSIALLHGADAETYLQAQDLAFWVQRDPLC